MFFKKIFKKIWERLKHTYEVEVEILRNGNKIEIKIAGAYNLMNFDKEKMRSFLKEVSLEFSDEKLAEIIAEKIVKKEFQ